VDELVALVGALGGVENLSSYLDVPHETLEGALSSPLR
jgi:hypothetical protein